MPNTNTTTTTTTPYVIEEFPGFLQFYSDGSVIRPTPPIFHIPVNDDKSIAWRHIIFDTINNLHLRIYKPASPSVTKLPIIYYIHGGGFVVGSCNWPQYHNYCLSLSSELQAIVIAPNYRLAPEHRLPIAIEDSFTAMKWLQAQVLSENPDTWLTDVADFSRVFIFGDSSGGTIGHHLAVQLGPGSVELAPVRVRGYILMAPFFGGTIRTRSEVEGPKDVKINLEVIDRLWRLSAPIGETTDHPLVNPFGPASPSLESVAFDTVLVVVAGNDLLRDRAQEYARRLKEWGKKFKYIEFEGEDHGFATLDPNCEAAKQLMQNIKQFLDQNLEL